MRKRALQQLIDQARRVRDGAAVRVAGAARNVEQAQQTLDMLSSYLNDHVARTAATTVIDAQLLGIRERFTRKLDDAIGEQARARDGMQAKAEQERGELVERQRRLLALEALRARRDARLARARERADQRQMDEIAAQTLMRRNRESNDAN